MCCVFNVRTCCTHSHDTDGILSKAAGVNIAMLLQWDYLTLILPIMNLKLMKSSNSGIHLAIGRCFGVSCLNAAILIEI